MQQKVRKLPNEPPDYVGFEQIRECGSSGVVTNTNCSNLEIQNELLSAPQKNEDNDLKVIFGEQQFDESSSDSVTLLGDEVMAEIPNDSNLNSVAKNYDLNYRPNDTLDYDFVRVPKEENLLHVDTEGFFEFQRVFKCTRPELIHLSKSLLLILYNVFGSKGTS